MSSLLTLGRSVSRKWRHFARHGGTVSVIEYVTLPSFPVFCSFSSSASFAPALLTLFPRPFAHRRYIFAGCAGATDATGQMRTNDKPYGIEKFIAAEVTCARASAHTIRCKIEKISERVHARILRSRRTFSRYLYVLYN